MAVILRIDVDRPYGKQGLLRHIASRIASDVYLPRIDGLGYLRDLETILKILNNRGRQAYVFFRRCTYPTPAICELMRDGGHEFGLHLEDSRSAETFRQELGSLEKCLNCRVTAFSKHGSGRMRLGRNHYAPYEPLRYRPWARAAGIKYFFGNLEDPELPPEQDGKLLSYPSAFWLEPLWRDVDRFPIEWLLRTADERNIVLLMHPDNVTASESIAGEFLRVIEQVDSLILPA